MARTHTSIHSKMVLFIARTVIKDKERDNKKRVYMRSNCKKMPKRKNVKKEMSKISEVHETFRLRLKDCKILNELNE